MTASVMAALLTSVSFRHGQSRYLMILKAGCVTLIIQWLLLLIPGRKFRTPYAGTEHLFWINIVTVATTSVVLAWLATAAMLARDPD
ncbi:hypothetical protein HN018_25615 (plasmid) [Lichenicola cladoniae]|uniref:Uncharacterized protein n=1 Tax=Lichenicola cladoniae TaxID=1484109 RepID=A0A6M8HYV4_9PROT|nr:hypothetical protein [Lichenicola cladoniae]NPD66771.1 hypothetical protein [Acetobacteraceae bacterium]QKE93528.1 hypothetical protein HN018_25615 [Lichenicola cladoniae]